MSRTKSSIKNFICAIIGQFFGLLASFISRVFFVNILGSEYLGLNGLFTNILSLLSLAELGVGVAITYCLYEPLSENNIKKCQMLMQLYKKIYIFIGMIILVIGLLLTPFLNIFIKEIPNISNINIIYILFVINTSISYFYSYKRNLIIADQNRYIATIYRYVFYVLVNILQIIYLVLTREYIGYLIIQIICTFLENLFVSLHADKLYPYLKNNNKIELDKKTKKNIIEKTKAMMMHKIGAVVINSTDNILLSKIVSLTAVGLYSNYLLIITALNTILGQVFNSLTASIGNLCASKDTKKINKIFNSVNFLGFWIFSFSSICLIVLFNPFIELWVGKKYLLSMNIVLILVINFYIKGLRQSVLTFRDAMGLFDKDKYKPIFESIINLVVSILLAIKFGIIGVFIGTFVSSITTCAWIEPYILYKYGLDKNVLEYFKTYFKYLFQTIVIGLITYFVCNLIIRNIYLAFILKLMICLTLPNIILFILYYNTEEFKYFYNKLFAKLINKLYKKINRGL